VIIKNYQVFIYGIISSKINTTDNYNIIEEDKITVNFIQIAKKQGCNITPDQLNMLLGLGVPKYSILEGSEYPYLFCVSIIVDINAILQDYGYEIGFSTKQKVFKNEFNAYHIAVCSYSGNDYYGLVHI
jgi:hypothetical protein